MAINTVLAKPGSSGLNGEIVFGVTDLRVGRVEAEPYTGRPGSPLWATVDVQVERETRQAEYQTIDHGRIVAPLAFSLTTAVWQRNLNDIEFGGATVRPLRDLVTWVGGFDAVKASRLADLGERWHLNTMRAGCAHQTAVYREGRYGREVDLANTPACPETGYRYGHAWLVEPLPAGFLDELQALLPPPGPYTVGPAS